MTDRLIELARSMESVAVPVSWEDVLERSTSDDGSQAAGQRPEPGHGRSRRPSHRFAVAAVLLLLGIVGGVLMIRDGGPTSVEAGPDEDPQQAPATTTIAPTPETTASTLPAIGTRWNNPVQVLAGGEYLVWSGEVGGEANVRADGWRYDPVTGTTTDIPVAPLAARAGAAGVWTGQELIVCCGYNRIPSGLTEPAADAAAFRPDDGTWRPLAPAPAGGGYTAGAVWTGEEMLVVSWTDTVGFKATLQAYDPAADRWEIRSAPQGESGRRGQVHWTGEELILWTTGVNSGPDRGRRYDPVRDEWSDLPALPEGTSPWYSSTGWTGQEFIVWGISQDEPTDTMVGARWRPETNAWEPMARAPIPPIVDWGEWTPGSQIAGFDAMSGLMVAVPVDAGDGAETRPLLTYDASSNEWARIGEMEPPGYDLVMPVVNGIGLRPDRSNPIAFRLSP